MKFFRLTLASSVLLALVLAFSLRSASSSEKIATQRPASPRADVAGPDQRYVNTDAGVSFMIPPGVRLADGTPGDRAAKELFRLVVRVERMDDIPLINPFPGYDRKSAKEIERALAGGTLPTITIDNPVDTVTIKKIDGTTDALIFPVFSRSPCSVTFELIAMLFRRNHRIFVSLRASSAYMIPLRPSLFTIDEATCGTQPIWKSGESQKEFLKLLTDGTLEPARDFMAAFSQIVDTIALTP